VRFGHPSGTLRVGAEAVQADGEWSVTKAVMSRSARVLMEGWVRVPGDASEARPLPARPVRCHRAAAGLFCKYVVEIPSSPWFIILQHLELRTEAAWERIGLNGQNFEQTCSRGRRAAA
jgi:hypothetical protein